MPARASHRLDAHFVPDDRSDAAVSRVHELVAEWIGRGLVDATGAGPNADALVEGGFASVRIDDPGQVVLYANQVGGFQVRCPECGAGLAKQFRPRVDTVCPACGTTSSFEALDIRPPAALGRASVVLVDVASAAVHDIPDGWRVILRRVG